MEKYESRCWNQEIGYKNTDSVLESFSSASSNLPLPGAWVLISSLTRLAAKKIFSCSTFKRPRVVSFMIEKAFLKAFKMALLRVWNLFMALVDKRMLMSSLEIKRIICVLACLPDATRIKSSKRDNYVDGSAAGIRNLSDCRWTKVFVGKFRHATFMKILCAS